MFYLFEVENPSYSWIKRMPSASDPADEPSRDSLEEALDLLGVLKCEVLAHPKELVERLLAQELVNRKGEEIRPAGMHYPKCSQSGLLRLREMMESLCCVKILFPNCAFRCETRLWHQAFFEPQTSCAARSRGKKTSTIHHVHMSAAVLFFRFRCRIQFRVCACLMFGVF